LAVDAPDTATGVGPGEAFADHGIAELIGDADTGGAGAEDDDALMAQGRAADADGRDDRGEGDGPGALEIIIKGTGLIPILPENFSSVIGFEIFPLQERAGEEPGDGLDVGLDKIVVLLAAYMASLRSDASLVPTSSMTGMTRLGLTPPAAV